MTPAFQDIVHGILKRTVSLGRVPYERYFQALSAGLHFNDQQRAGARECARKSWIAKDAPAEGSAPENVVESTGRLPRPTD